MVFETILYVAYSSAAIFISSITAIMFWKRRKVAGALSLSLLTIFATWWSLSDLISAININLSSKILWNDIAYLGIAFVPVTWFVFSLQYTGQDKYLYRKNIIRLCIIPAITVILSITNKLHHFFKLGADIESLGPGSLTVVVSKYGPGFYIHTFYSYILIMTGTIILLKKLIRLPRVYRNQAIIMTFAVLAPLIGNILYIAGISPSEHIDPTAFSFTISGLLCFWGVFHYKLVDLIPSAREAIIENMDDIIIVLDLKDRIVDINPSGKNVFNIGSVNIIGQPIWDILGAHYDSFKMYAPEERIIKKVIFEDKGEKKFVEMRVFPLYDSKGKPNGRFIVMRDVSALERTMIELEESRKVAVDASRAKSQFLAAMSHEIRTPLNGIIGMTELLSSEGLNEEGNKYIKAIEYSTNSLLDIINGILDFSKIEAGKMELEETGFNIINLIKNIIDFFRHREDKTGVVLESEIDKTIPEIVIGDQTRLGQILSNLLSNAFKFTKDGSISINVEKIKEEKEEVLLDFSVTDTGIGIPKEKIGRLFDSFYQVDSSTTRKYGGTGLGLAIVKSLIDLMGGTITVESEAGKGSKFSFKLSFKVYGPLSPSGASEEKRNIHSGRKLKILLAEDNEVNQMFMIKMLSRKDYIVDKADTGKRVLEMLEKSEYDIILMDIQMPEMDGMEAAKKIRSAERVTGGHVVIIALTANATEQDKLSCLESGMDDYLPKPVRSEKLFACIDRNIKQPNY